MSVLQQVAVWSVQDSDQPLMGTPSQTPVLARKDTLVLTMVMGRPEWLGLDSGKPGYLKGGWQFKPQVMQTC